MLQGKEIRSIFLDQHKLNPFWKFFFFLVVIGISCFLVFQADYTGTHHDEAYSWQYFSRDIHTARHSYHNTNNHVLNSILICLGRKLCGGYEQYIRVFPVLSGLIFFLSLAYILKQAIRHIPLQIVSFILITTLPFLFDYLYMARGYTYGLSAMAVYIAAVFFWLKHPLRCKHAWIPILFLSLINVYSLASMISGVFCVFALNAVFVLFYSFQIYQNLKSKVWPILIHLFGILLISGLLLYFFYQPILDKILHADENRYVKGIADSWQGWQSFVPYLKKLLVDIIFGENTGGRIGSSLFFLLSVSGFFVFLAQLVKSWKTKSFFAFLQDRPQGIFLLLFFCFYLIVLLLFSVAAGKSPGLYRSQIFLIPGMLLVCLWCIDGLLEKLSGRRIIQSILIVFLLWTGLRVMPYPYRLGSSSAGMARPTLRRLKALDPDMTWNLCFSKKMEAHAMNFKYYKQFDYKFNITRLSQCHILICRPEECPEKSILLDYEYFLEKNNCFVVLVRGLNTEKMVIEARPIRTSK